MCPETREVKRTHKQTGENPGNGLQETVKRAKKPHRTNKIIRFYLLQFTFISTNSAVHITTI